MPAWLQSLITALLDSVLPAILKWVTGLLPKPVPVAGALTVSAEDKAAYRATVRQWVNDMLTEVGNAVIKKGLIPSWLAFEVPVVEQLLANALDQALDAAGL